MKGPQKQEERGSGQEKGLKPLGSLGTAGERMSRGAAAPGMCPVPPLDNRAYRWHLGKENFQVYKGFSKLLFFFLL